MEEKNPIREIMNEGKGRGRKKTVSDDNECGYSLWLARHHPDHPSYGRSSLNNTDEMEKLSSSTSI